MTRSGVYKVIDSERDYQDEIWNAETTTSAGQHEVAAWLTFMRAYLREAEEAISRNPEPKATRMAMESIRKITAMGVCCMEQHGAPRRVVPS